MKQRNSSSKYMRHRRESPWLPSQREVTGPFLVLTQQPGNRTQKGEALKDHIAVVAHVCKHHSSSKP